MRYVIIYTNDRTVQGHRVYCLVTRVNILLQGKVHLPLLCRFQLLNSITSEESFVLSLGVHFIHVGNCWIIIPFLNEIDFIWKWLDKEIKILYYIL